MAPTDDVSHRNVSDRNVSDRQRQIREHARSMRSAQMEKDDLSRTILDSFLALPEAQSARATLFYLDVRSEVRTRDHVAQAFNGSSMVVVPYCVEDHLRLFRLESMDELDNGRYGILEPRHELRCIPEKQISVEAVDLIMVPGVAFDRSGGRIGHGRGYYDRLLGQARPETKLVGIAFDCQVFPEIPMQNHDVYLDKVVTQSTIYVGRGRR